MKNDSPSSSRRGSIVIQTMLARLAKEEQEWKLKKAEKTVDPVAPPKAMAAKPESAQSWPLSRSARGSRAGRLLGRGNVALFVLLVVGIIVALTWVDFREINKDWALPDWAKGTALAGVVAALLTGAASFASFWLQDAGRSSGDSFVPAPFWPELGFVLCVMAVMIAAMRKNRLRVMILFVGLLSAVFVFLFRLS